MASRNSTLQSALWRLLRERDDDPSSPGVPRRRATARGAALRRPSSSAVQREMDQFRHGQGLPYWHHDRRSD